MNALRAYRTLFVGTLVQESFLSVGGADDPATTVDSPFCRDGKGRPTLRGSGLAGALVATLRRMNAGNVPVEISGSQNGRVPSVWRFFNSHPLEIGGKEPMPAFRQHVAIDARTGAAATGALFDLETLPPATYWPFLLEVDTSRFAEGADLARAALMHWVHGRCLLGREVARGMGWMRLDGLCEYTLTTDHIDFWPNAETYDDYHCYIRKTFSTCGKLRPKDANDAAFATLPGWIELEGAVHAGQRTDDVGKGYGIDSLSIGGHATEELAAAWDGCYLAPDGMTADAAKAAFDPDFAVVGWSKGNQRVPYIPGSSLRGPLRHEWRRLLRAQAGCPSAATSTRTVDEMVNALFGTTESSARLLLCDALPVDGSDIKLAWQQHHAEDEFAGSTYKSAKFDRVAVMQGSFRWRMILEDATETEMTALAGLLELGAQGQLGIGGGQWRGHGWLRWQCDQLDRLDPTTSRGASS